MKVIVILTAMLWYEGIGMSAQTDFTRVEFKTITECQDYVFKNKFFLITAFTHKSSDSENNYERLEFLGDRVLGIVISKKLLELYPY